MPIRFAVRPIGWLLGIGCFLIGASAEARPAHRKAMAEYFGPFLPAKLNACTTCHLSANPTDDDHEHNAFGKRLVSVREELKKAGRSTDIVARLLTVADEDSDGDGASNILELLSGHNPGDAKDAPSAAEVTAARKAWAALRASKAGQAWKPFEPVRRPAVPVAGTPEWSRNAIDAFIAAEHEKHGLRPRPEAAKHILLRRVYLDLIGLPPTPDELHAFLTDSSADAYEKVVDRLLDSPRYGERWGRHWMDVWRYSDWAGFGNEVRESHRHIWHWRDWIVESLNADKGYDRMIVEMLAGDEIAPLDPDTLRATGFLVRPWFIFNRNTWLDNAVEHTAKAFLGITLNCARCHEHKYDPIEQEEYYRFRAFFEPYHVRLDRVPGEPDLNKAGIPRVFDAYLDAKTYVFERGNEAHPDKKKALSPAAPAALGGPPLRIQPIALPQMAYRPDKRAFVIQETLEASAASVAKLRARLIEARFRAAGEMVQSLSLHPLPALLRSALTSKALNDVAFDELYAQMVEVRHSALAAAIRAEELEDAGKKDTAEWRRVAESASRLQRRQSVLGARALVVLARQSLITMGATYLELAEKALAQAESEESQPPTIAYTRRPASYPQAPPSYGQTSNAPYPCTSTGRRLALARWIADKKNPLTARVAVNHIWMRHFGKPLVPTVFDFGGNGRPPTHPALLDWLACELMASPGRESGGGWSMKHLHWLIVTSAAYRMDSNDDPANAAKDADNVYLWRMNSRRMEAETVRDSLLHVAGQLDETMGGPDIDQNLGLTSRRRSIYLRHAAEKQTEFLLLFDAAPVTECYRRVESVVPQQALALANSTLSQAQARLLARKLASQAEDAAAFIRLGFEHVLGRLPTEAEQCECERFLTDQAALLADRAKLSAFTSGPASSVPPSADPTLRAREDLIHVLMNHNEFVTIR
jgi:hypothetical protein